MKVLITSGGTEEPIDGVRYISNFSTGTTGAVLADRLSELGAEVTLLHGHRAVLPQKALPMDSFRGFQDLDRKLQEHLKRGKFDAVIHLAAVSDFSVEYIQTSDGQRLAPGDRGKISSDGDIDLHLKRNHKILDRLKDYNNSDKELIVTGFKLTDTESSREMEKAVEKILKSGKVDFAVHNNLREITKLKHPAKIYRASGEVMGQTTTKREMADLLFSLIEERYFGGHDVSGPKHSRIGELK